VPTINLSFDVTLANSEEINCSKQEDEEKYICEVMVGKDLNVSLGVYDDQYSGKLEELWSKWFSRLEFQI
jgi:serine protease inhibitor ecotin